MTTSSDLLRLLEPTVRPVSNGQGTSVKTSTAFENQSFEQLLQQSQQDASQAPMQMADEQASVETKVPSVNPLQGLSAFIDNPTARALMSGTQSQS